MITNQEMNLGESSGESSSCGRENGAAPLESERPHKKARFPWQIKGKHHLKNQIDQLTACSAHSLAASGETKHETASPESKTPVEPASPLETVVPTSNEASLENEAKPKRVSRLVWNGSNRPQGLASSTQNLPLETVISLAESMLLRSEVKGSDFTFSDEQFQTLLEQNMGTEACNFNATREAYKLRREEDKCISRWQATQTVKGCFDNTINRVLESWMSAPAPAEERFLALDFARIMNELPRNDDNVENEGILMAINAHGLQNVPTVDGIPAIAPTEQLARTLASDVPICEDSDSSLCSDDFEIPPERDCCSPWRDHGAYGDMEEQTKQVAVQFVPPWIHDGRNQPEAYRYLDSNRSTAGEDYEYEFMNTAVIQAIKSKGLMASGTDFG